MNMKLNIVMFRNMPLDADTQSQGARLTRRVGHCDGFRRTTLYSAMLCGVSIKECMSLLEVGRVSTYSPMYCGVTGQISNMPADLPNIPMTSRLVTRSCRNAFH